MADIKLFSWNVNGLRAVLRKGALQQFLQDQNPDILCLQEIKCTKEQVDFNPDGYKVFWNPAKRLGYSGTMILVRDIDLKPSFELIKENPQVFRDDLKGEQSVAGATRTALRASQSVVEKNLTGFSQAKKNGFEEIMKDEGRILTVDLGNFYLVNVYTPNSKPDLSRLELRHTDWDPGFKEYLKELEKEKPVITCGDFNCAHEEIDLARPNTNHHNAGFTDEEREGLTNLLKRGFLDTFRTLNPTAQRYTWWSHWGKARENNVGWRIDYFFISESLRKHLKSAEIYESQLGSDHCPISITMEIN